MNQLFGASNPLLSAMGQLIERAIEPLSPQTNLGLYFEICDMINAKEENAKDAFKSMRKLLSVYAGRNWAVVSKILILLDTCTNNCNRRFHALLSNKEFLNELKHMIGPKFQPPLDIQEKVLALIQHWFTMFRGDPEFKSMDSFYYELRSKSVEFPQYNPEMFSAISTSDETSISIQQRPLRQTPRTPPPTSQPQSHSILHQQQTSSGVIKLNEEQCAKLNSELDIVESNVQVLNEILTNLQPQQQQQQFDANSINKSGQNEEDISLLKELNKTCREMQKRITQLIGNITNENIINELLRINDDLNNAFLRYDRFEKGLLSVNKNNNNNSNNYNSNADNNQQSTLNVHSKIPIENKSRPNAGSMNASGPEDKPLIDFGESSDAKSQDLLEETFKQLGITSAPATTSSNANPSAQSGHNDLEYFLNDENEIREMENWLKQQGGAASASINDDFASKILPKSDTNSKY